MNYPADSGHETYREARAGMVGRPVHADSLSPSNRASKLKRKKSACVDLGLILIDTAEMYGEGRSTSAKGTATSQSNLARLDGGLSAYLIFYFLNLIK